MGYRFTSQIVNHGTSRSIPFWISQLPWIYSQNLSSPFLRLPE